MKNIQRAKIVIQILEVILFLAGIYFWKYLWELVIGMFCFICIIILNWIIQLLDQRVIKRLEKSNNELAEKLKKYEEVG